MIPPLPPSTVAQNPQFAALHKQLTSQLLNSDCSTAARFPAVVTGSSSGSGAGSQSSTGRKVLGHEARLSRDGASTSNALKKSQKLSEEEKLEADLRAVRLRYVTTEIVLRALRHAAVATEPNDRNGREAAVAGVRGGAYRQESTETILSEDVRELMLTLSVLLDHLKSQDGRGATSEDLELFAEILEDFEANLDVISSAVGQEIVKEHELLSRLLAEPATSGSQTSSTVSSTTSSRRVYYNPSSKLSSSSPVTSQLLSLHELLTAHHAETSQVANELNSSVSKLFSSPLPPHETLLPLLLSNLELSVHNSSHRHLRTRVTHLSTVSEGMSLKSRVLLSRADSAVYTPQVRDAMESYMVAMEETEISLQNREQAVQEALEEYKDVHGMAEIGKRYATLEDERTRLKDEIRRLEDSGVGGGRSIGRLR